MDPLAPPERLPEVPHDDDGDGDGGDVPPDEFVSDHDHNDTTRSKLLRFSRDSKTNTFTTSNTHNTTGASHNPNSNPNPNHPQPNYQHYQPQYQPHEPKQQWV